jgi:o-succinylbenzoate synthase
VPAARPGAAALTRDLSAPGAALAVEAIELHLVRLDLVEPFETSFGSFASRLVVLVRMQSDGLEGWGEIVAGEQPLYSYETVGTAVHAVREFFAPALLRSPLTGLADLAARLDAFRGHPMARAGLELAFVDLLARARGVSISALLGGTRERIEAGVSLGIQRRLPDLLDRVDRYVRLGYRRVKLKIKPGWDVDVVDAARRKHPAMALSADANAAYRLADCDHLRRLDAFGLQMIEQPLDHDDLVDHAELARSIETPICLDESVGNVRAARQALDLGSCRIVNMKVGRVGGYSQALAIHDLCLSRGVPVWCGGMLESGVGRAHNIALASLPGFTLPGDISASRRYFERDIIAPEVEVGPDGMVQVPRGVGLGFEIDRAFVDSATETVERIVPPRPAIAVP